MPQGRLVYLAVPPSLYAAAVENLAREQVAVRIRDRQATPWIRVVIEKPFGRSLETARELNRLVHEHLSEHQIFRIDHYLGKETVQNILVFRFANSIFEPVCKPDSQTPTFAAIRFMVDNWRWQGVPFYLRSGKRLARRVSEIAIQFRRPPHLIFRRRQIQELAPNLITMRVQPDEGISLRFEIKVPSLELEMKPVEMDFAYREAFGATEHSAYETLLVDCTMGDATLFTRRDEVESAWAVVDPIVQAWESRPAPDFPNYAAGTWGPPAADALLAPSADRWREP